MILKVLTAALVTLTLVLTGCSTNPAPQQDKQTQAP